MSLTRKKAFHISPCILSNIVLNHGIRIDCRGFFDDVVCAVTMTCPGIRRRFRFKNACRDKALIRGRARNNPVFMRSVFYRRRSHWQRERRFDIAFAQRRCGGCPAFPLPVSRNTVDMECTVFIDHRLGGRGVRVSIMWICVWVWFWWPRQRILPKH